jgi:hypothetical protein
MAWHYSSILRVQFVGMRLRLDGACTRRAPGCAADGCGRPARLNTMGILDLRVRRRFSSLLKKLAGGGFFVRLVALVFRGSGSIDLLCRERMSAYSASSLKIRMRL